MKYLLINGISLQMERINSISQVLSAYVQTWGKANNICALQEIIQDKLDLVNQYHNINIFAANHLPFPNFLTGLQAQYNFTKELSIWILDSWVQP